MIKTAMMIVIAAALTGCAATVTDPAVSRDQTLERMTKIALINEMLNSPDPIVRAKAAEIAAQFIAPEKKKNIFGF